MKQTVTLSINKSEVTVETDTRTTLLELLRKELKMFGTREACGIGMCGACTVLIDGRAISSCLLLAVLAEGSQIESIEGMASDGTLHPIQQAFIDNAGFQCSYCTPGFIMSVKALLEENPAPQPHEIREYLAGNLCRCGSYVKIEAAVLDAATRLNSTAKTSANDGGT